MLRVVAAPTNDVTTVQSAVLGRIEVGASAIVTFVEPVAGFRECRRYALLPYLLHGREDPSMGWLQAMDPPFHTFLVTDPWSAVPDYEPEIADADAERIGADAFADTCVFGILTVSHDERELTINLRAPLLVNTREQVGKQVVILNPDRYGTRHRVCELP